MTLCIAAICQHQGEPRIVLCSDWKVEEELYGSETADKQENIMPGWIALQAGVSSRAMELKIAYRDYFAINPPKINGILSAIKEPVNIQRYKIMDEYIQASIGKSYEWLLTEGKESLPDEMFSRLVQAVEALKLDAQLLICGFVKTDTGKPFPVVGVVNDTLQMPFVRLAENFASVGSGLVVADSVLHRREHQCDMPLKKALYHVAEAKYLGEIASGVGQATTMGVLLPTGRFLHVSESGENFLNASFEKYGPKALDGSEDWTKLPPGFLKTDSTAGEPSGIK